MSGFMLRFLISNLFLGGMAGALLLLKRLFGSGLSPRMQYRLWFLFLALLAVPFLPLRAGGLPQIFPWLEGFGTFSGSNIEAAAERINEQPGLSIKQLPDFAVNSSAHHRIGTLLFTIWIAGMLLIMCFLVRSLLRLHTLKQSALPLQSPEIRTLYQNCLKEAGITKMISVCSTAFLASPVLAGFLRPCIYLPIHLISDHQSLDLRFMLLHELQHYKRRDNLAGFFMNLAGLLYWFNPAVWYALSEMRIDREAACDASVLEMLTEDSYTDYGNTLIHFAEKVSFLSFPFAAGMGGTMKQMKRRILCIAAYRKPTLRSRLKETAAFSIAAVLLLCFAPILPASTADQSDYEWDTAGEAISISDLSAYFDGYEGSFVLYDLEEDHWEIYNMDRALTRVPPDSTYKIYDALFALEEGIITPEDTLLPWDKTTQPFDEWNQDQTLASAMAASVNWYFQALDRQLGKAVLRSYVQKIGYGNEQITGELSSYWLESSLKISPAEQVKLLTGLHQNSFGFAPEHILAVKDSLLLAESEQGAIYGKTGTGCINGQDRNGWFVGFSETDGHTCFFAVNIAGASNASGSAAAQIALSILSDRKLWR